MMRNVGNLDRVARLVLSLVAALVAVAVGTTTWGIVLWVVAAVLAVTALAGFCPLYRALGLSTRNQGAIHH